MKPLFKLDTQTQRSFMACVKLEELEIAIQEENISLEIKLATVLYYFKTCEYKTEVSIIIILIQWHGKSNITG